MSVQDDSRSFVLSKTISISSFKQYITAKILWYKCAKQENRWELDTFGIFSDVDYGIFILIRFLLLVINYQRAILP